MIRTARTLMMLSGLVRRSDFKVLTGEGADEIFAGYNRFRRGSESAVSGLATLNPPAGHFCLKNSTPLLFRHAQSGQPNAFLFGFLKRPARMWTHHLSHVVRWQNTHQLKNFFTKETAAAGSDLSNFVDRIAGNSHHNLERWSPLSRPGRSACFCPYLLFPGGPDGNGQFHEGVLFWTIGG